MYNFSNMSKIRLYYAKLLIETDDHLGAKCLLLDNVRDCQCELMVRYSRRTGVTIPDMKIIKCVASAHPVQAADDHASAARESVLRRRRLPTSERVSEDYSVRLLHASLCRGELLRYCEAVPDFEHCHRMRA